VTASKIISDSPVRPTEADTELLASAQATALATRDLYQAAVAAGATGDHTATFVSLAAHHDAYAQAISSLIGRAAPQARDDEIFSANKSDFESDATTAALAAHTLENSLVAAHTELVGSLEGTEGAALIASMVVIESRHVVALATIAGKSPVADIDLFLVTPEAAQADAQTTTPVA
jgi:hypothetical protein